MMAYKVFRRNQVDHLHGVTIIQPAAAAAQI
jgi:hypothetical protein